MLEIIVWYLLGILIGFAIARYVVKEKPVGSIRVDCSDPDGPYLFLELEKDIDAIISKKQVSVTVYRKDFIPHE